MLVEAGFTERQAQACWTREGFGALVTKDHLDARLRELGLQLTLHLGGMIAAGVAILAALELLAPWAAPNRMSCGVCRPYPGARI